MKIVFVVDDNDTNLLMAREALDTQYRVFTLASAAKMFKLLEKITPDLILLDIEMPEMDGFEALQILKSRSEYSNVPVIFVTGMTDPAAEVKGFKLGVVDFVSKPFSAPVLQNRIKTHLDIDGLIRERTAELQRLQSGIIYVIADIVENRDASTGGHVERTVLYIDLLVKAMKTHHYYEDVINEFDPESFASSARLHDVGKITIPDSILNKPGKLTAEEFDIMKTHAVKGEEIIEQIVDRTGNVDFLNNAKLFAGYHHERWDGAGYPYGLSGRDIPLQGRLMAIVDVYDALTSKRPYKDAFPEEEAVRIITEGASTQFDPDIVDAFLKVREEFDSVRQEYQTE